MTKRESQELQAAIEDACQAVLSPSAVKFAAITYYVTFGNIDPSYVLVHRLAGEELSMRCRRRLWYIHHKYSRRCSDGE